jgi:HlyD family secretion protein
MTVTSSCPFPKASKIILKTLSVCRYSCSTSFFSSPFAWAKNHSKVVASKTINSLIQSIASQKLLAEQAKAQLALKLSGATDNDIAAQTAAVEQAKAAANSIRVKLGNTRMFSPISGTVTRFDAKVGEVALPGSPLVSIISSGVFEINAEVPETDIGKVSVGNTVKIIFDAFPNETFNGKVFYIDPAQTINQGVVDYKIKISFDNPDERMKSGLTANLELPKPPSLP